MRLFIFLILFASQFSFASSAFFQVDTYSSDPELAQAAYTCAAKVQSYKNNNPEADYYLEPTGETSPISGKPMLKCMVSLQPCDPPKAFFRVGKSCETPCEQKSLGSITTKTHGFLTCVDKCAVSQVGDSTCVGVNATGYCTANYSQTGSFCPDEGTQPTQCSGTECNQNPDNPGDGSGNGSGSGSGSGGAGSGGGAGSSGGGGSGGAGGAGGSGSAGSGGGGSGGQGGQGGQGGTGGAGGAGGAGGQGGVASGTSTGGASCEQPPTCSGDSLQCQQMFQTYYLRCPAKSLSEHGDGKYNGTGHALDINNRLQQAKDKYSQKVSQIQNNLRNSVHASVTGGGSVDCPTYEIYGIEMRGGFCRVSPFVDNLGALFPAIASILAAFMILRRD